MTIIVDCNSDKIQIIDGIVKFEMPCKHSVQTIKILLEILNILNPTNVSLEKIDEDTHSLVEEW